MDLAAASLDALVARSGIDPAAVEDVIMGCVSQAGEQAMQVGRIRKLNVTAGAIAPGHPLGASGNCAPSAVNRQIG